ncbi:MAG: Kelch repeat-containing protein, partial [Archangium sp.]
MTILAVALWACAPGEMVEGSKGEQTTGSTSQKLMQTVGPLQQARAQHTSTTLQDGRVLFAGGSIDTNGNATATVEVYDPATRTTSFVAPMHNARRAHAAVLLQDGSVLVLGGIGPYGDLGNPGVMPYTERYNPTTNTWTVMAPMPRSSYWHSATLLADGRVLLVGGVGDAADTHIFDPTTNTWTATGSLSQGRLNHVALRLPDNRILVMGGMGATDAVSPPYSPEGQEDDRRRRVTRP